MEFLCKRYKFLKFEARLPKRERPAFGAQSLSRRLSSLKFVSHDARRNALHSFRECAAFVQGMRYVHLGNALRSEARPLL